MARVWFFALLGAAAVHGAGCIPTDRPLADPGILGPVQPRLRVPDALLGDPTNVPTNVIIRIALDRFALASSIDETTVWIEVDGTRLEAAVAYDSFDREIIVTPAADLPPSTEVRIVVGAGVRSDAGPRFEGAALGEDVRFELTTGDGPDLIGPEIATTPGVIEVVAEKLRDPECGDGVCNDGMSGGSPSPELDERSACSFDCGMGLCGNGICDAGEGRLACPPDCATPFALRATFAPEAATDDHSAEGELRWFAYVATTSGGQNLAAPNRISRMGSEDGAALYRILELTACGDGVCQGENAETCPADCPQFCGDEVCTGTENTGTCRSDCRNSCGDGVCGSNPFREEAVCPDPLVPCNLCPADCDIACGDMMCNGGETSETCPRDCGFVCNNGTCDALETSLSCPADCAEACPDGACSSGETEDTCPADCGAEYFVVIGVADASGNETLTSFELSAVTAKSIPRDFLAAYAETGCHCSKCHGDEARAPVDFWMPVSGEVGVPLTGVDPHALLLESPSREKPSTRIVESGNAAASYLLLKMVGARCASALFGSRGDVDGFSMAPDMALKTDETQHCHALAANYSVIQVMDWIDLGALNDSDPAEVGSCE